MKNYIIWVMCIILACFTTTAKAQNIQREGKIFIAGSTKGAKASNDVATPYYWQDKKGNKYPIFLHKYSKGEKLGKWGAYIIRKSEKSGKEYKYFVPNNEEIVNSITKEMSI